MSIRDDEWVGDELTHRSVLARAAAILRVRLDLSIEDAVNHLFRMADEAGVEDNDLARLIVRACE